jgi:hypothetical protein
MPFPKPHRSESAMPVERPAIIPKSALCARRPPNPVVLATARRGCRAFQPVATSNAATSGSQPAHAVRLQATYAFRKVITNGNTLRPGEGDSRSSLAAMTGHFPALPARAPRLALSAVERIGALARLNFGELGDDGIALGLSRHMRCSIYALPASSVTGEPGLPELQALTSASEEDTFCRTLEAPRSAASKRRASDSCQ